MKINVLAIGLAFVLSGTFFLQTAAAQTSAVGLEEDVVDEVNASTRTLVIAGQTYVLDTSARLEDSEGRPISISEIRATRNDGDGDLVEYSLSGRGGLLGDGGPRSIESLRVLGQDYE